MMHKQQIENHGELSEKRIVVLGGSSGIGLAVAQQVVARGGQAIIASSNADRVKQGVAMLDAKAEGHTLDLTNERGLQNFFQKIGDFDHLVFTAGDTLQLNELATTDLTKARNAFELRYWAVWLRSSTQARISARTARSCSQPESQAGARSRDGQWPQASAERSKLLRVPWRSSWHRFESTRYVPASFERTSGKP